LDLIIDEVKEKNRKKFSKTGGNRRQDHGTRNNSDRHANDESYYTGHSDEERAILRRNFRHGAEELFET